MGNRKEKDHKRGGENMVISCYLIYYVNGEEHFVDRATGEKLILGKIMQDSGVYLENDGEYVDLSVVKRIVPATDMDTRINFKKINSSKESKQFHEFFIQRMKKNKGIENAKLLN